MASLEVRVCEHSGPCCCSSGLLIERVHGESPQTLVPVKNRILFNDFIVSKRQDGRKVLFDINEEAFASKFQTVLPILKTAMGEERRLDIEEKELRAFEKAEKFKIRQMTTVLENLKESNGDEEDGMEEPECEEEEEEQKVEEERESDLIQVLQVDGEANQYVGVYSHARESPLKAKVMMELDRFGLQCKDLDVENLTEQLDSCRCVVLLVEGVQDKDKRTRKEIAATMARIVQAAQSVQPRKRVFPLFENRHFLDLSKMYSLSRSEFHYFVDGVGESRSKTELVHHLRGFIGVG